MPRTAISFKSPDGSRTRARDGHSALVFWFMGIESQGDELPEDAEPLKLYKGRTYHFLEDQGFIDQMIAAIERHSGHTVEVDSSLPHLEQCQGLLQFLQQIGMISDLDFNSSLQSFLDDLLGGGHV